MIVGIQANIPDFSIGTLSNAGKIEGIDKDENIGGSKRVQPSECQTCKNRRYQDGSDEMVSFKSPGTINPKETYAKIMGHEQEHVANARAEGRKENKELVSANVTLQTSICPECGRSYISGGTTKTIMRTYNDDAFSQNLKSMERDAATGDNVDEYA